jgi:hypothetical protein
MWSFEGGVAAPWSAMSDPTAATTPNGASVQSSADRASPGSGSRSLKVSFTNANLAEVGTQICSSGFDLYNYTLNFDLYSDFYSGWVVGIAWSGAYPGSFQFSASSSVYSAGSGWQTFHAIFGGDNSSGAHFNATNIGIYMAVEGITITGPVYIDNIYLTN